MINGDMRAFRSGTYDVSADEWIMVLALVDR